MKIFFAAFSGYIINDSIIKLNLFETGELDLLSSSDLHSKRCDRVY